MLEISWIGIDNSIHRYRFKKSKLTNESVIPEEKKMNEYLMPIVYIELTLAFFTLFFLSQKNLSPR